MLNHAAVQIVLTDLAPASSQSSHETRAQGRAPRPQLGWQNGLAELFARRHRNQAISRVVC
jgi:hypothetical protein